MKKSHVRKIYILALTAIFLLSAACTPPTQSGAASGNEEIRQFAVDPGAIGDDTADGLYFTDWLFPAKDMGYLFYFDDSASKAVKLCSRTNCTHSDSSCDAWFDTPFPSSIQYYNSRIFLWAFKYVPGSGSMCSLYSVKPDGTDQIDYGYLNTGGRNASPTESLICSDTVYILCNMGPSGSFPQSYEVFRQPLQKDQKGESIYKSPNPDKEHYVSNMHVTGNTLWLTENEYAADSSYRQDLKAVDLSTGDVRTVLSAENGWISYVVTDDSVYYSVLNRNANAYGPVQKLSRHLGSTELFIPQGGKLTFDGENFYLADYSQSDGAGSIRIADKTGTVVQTIDAAEIQKLAAKPQVIMFKNHIMIYDLANNPNEPDLYTMQIAKKSDILSGTTDPWTAITAFQSSRN